jgi:hypothetical protein
MKIGRRLQEDGTLFVRWGNVFSEEGETFAPQAKTS